jgi:hypothetical protein
MRATLIKTGRAFADRDWMLGTSGSLSVRLGDDPLRVLITVSGVDKGDLAEEHFLEVSDFNGIADPKASSEAFYEGAIMGSTCGDRTRRAASATWRSLSSSSRLRWPAARSV